MGKSRRKRSVFGKRGKSNAPNHQQKKTRSFEHLEERQMLTVAPVYATAESVQATLDRAVDLAFQKAADLSQYSNAQLEDSTRWVVKSSGGLSAGNFQNQTGLAFGGNSPVSNAYFAFAGSASSSQIVASLSNNPSVEYFYPEVGYDAEKHALLNDPLIRSQWHLRSTGQLISLPNEVNNFSAWGADLRAERAWEFSTGENVVVGVVDDGLYYVHPDIAPNYDPSLGYNAEELDGNPAPDATDQDFHGTAVGGIIGAKGDNNEGVSGVAPDVTLGGIRLPFSDPFQTNFTDAFIYDALTFRNDVYDIKNNSWGTSFGRAITTSGPFQIQAMIDSVFLGRNGLGTILVNSSGNGGDGLDRNNHDDFSSRMHAIAISGFGPNDQSVSYAEGGTSVFATAPTGSNPPNVGILTTDVGGEVGYNSSGVSNDLITDFLEDTDYTSGFNGTSASSPAAAGVVALIVGAARENGIELSVRDVKHILALSTRRIDPGDSGWQTDLRPLFYDPVDIGGIPYGPLDANFPGTSWVPHLPDPGTGFADDTVSQIANASNSAGYYVHDGIGSGYGHGAVDAGLAAELASTWQTVGTQHETIVYTAALPGGNLLVPAGEIVDGDRIIPGSVGGLPGFGAYFDLYFDPDDEAPEEPPANTRGQNIPIIVPANMSIEEIEITLNISIPAEDSDKFRMTLISPDGVQSELTNWIPQGSIGPLTATGLINHTFTTNKHWGERSEGVGRISPLDGSIIEANTILGVNGEVTAGVWTLAIENYSGSAAIMNPGSSISFHGSQTPVVNVFGDQLGGRIQGTIGLDLNNDDTFNFTGIVASEDVADHMEYDTTVELATVASGMDAAYEAMASRVMVYVDIDKDGEFDSTEPHMRTGADGNYYFDLPYNQPGSSYDVRFVMPEGYDLVGDDSHEFIIGLQDDGSVRSTHVTGNFLLRPQAVTFEGNVFADFDRDAVQDFGETTAEEFRVFVDINENGKLDFVDTNANLVFDNGIDEALEPMAITGADGSFSIVVDTNVNTDEDFFGNSVFLNDYYVGAEYYTLMLDQRDGWIPTGADISARGFALPDFNGAQADSLPFHRMFVEAGETMVDLDFSVAPEVGSISGFVYNDINQNGTRQSGENGLAGFTVFLDLDQDGTLGTVAGNPEPSIITGSNGNYLFENLPAGTYDIQIIPAPGFEDPGDQISPIGGFHNNRVLASGQALGGGIVDFGFYDPTAVASAPRDYGDLDSPFLTTAAAGGASHGIVDGFYLGAGVSVDADGQPSSGASTDTMDDGVTFLSPVEAGALVSLSVDASSSSLFLQGWVDFNADGDFDDEGEHLSFGNAAGVPLPFSKQTRLDTGTNELTFRAPDAVMGSSIAARFRYGEGGVAQFNQPNGVAILGEVEDYVVPATISTSFIEPIVGDFDGSNLVDAGDYIIWQQTLGSNLDLRADANANGVVDMADFALWRDNLGAVATASLNIGQGAALTVAAESEAPALGFITVSNGDLASFELGSSQVVSSSTIDESPLATPSLAVELALDAAFGEEEEDDDTSYQPSSTEAEQEALALALEDELLAI